jgi:hypothetical protein
LPPEVRRKGLVIRFASDNRALIIRDPLGWSHRWKLPYYHESLDKLEKTVGLLAAQQIDSTESLTPQTKENLRKLWESRANFLHPVDSPTVEQ